MVRPFIRARERADRYVEGLWLRLGFELETAFAERELEMIVRARAGDSAPTAKFQMGYFVIGQGGSGWKEFTPGPRYKDYKIKLKKGALKGETRGDFAGIWPDLDGKGRTLNVASVGFDQIIQLSHHRYDMIHATDWNSFGYIAALCIKLITPYTFGR